MIFFEVVRPLRFYPPYTNGLVVHGTVVRVCSLAFPKDPIKFYILDYLVIDLSSGMQENWVQVQKALLRFSSFFFY